MHRRKPVASESDERAVHDTLAVESHVLGPGFTLYMSGKGRFLTEKIAGTRRTSAFSLASSASTGSRDEPSGYRGHHIVVKRAGRIVEVQVRTENQHTWAESVESSGRLIDRELKWGDGPGEVLGYYSLLGAVVDSADRGEAISRSTLQATEAAREAAIRRMLDMSRGDTNG